MQCQGSSLSPQGKVNKLAESKCGVKLNLELVVEKLHSLWSLLTIPEQNFLTRKIQICKIVSMIWGGQLTNNMLYSMHCLLECFKILLKIYWGLIYLWELAIFLLENGYTVHQNFWCAMAYTFPICGRWKRTAKYSGNENKPLPLYWHIGLCSEKEAQFRKKKN